MAYEILKKRTRQRVTCHSISIPAEHSEDISEFAKSAGLSVPKFIAKVFVDDFLRRLAKAKVR